jgi:hypothetical protein
MTLRLVAGLFAYLIPTFILGYVWHLVLFKARYDALEIYRADMIIPFGVLAMLIQGVIFAWLYQQLFAMRDGSWLANGLLFAALGGVLSWTLTTVAVAAKHRMASVPDFVMIETAFTAVQWVIAGPLIAFVFSRLGSPQ